MSFSGTIIRLHPIPYNDSVGFVSHLFRLLPGIMYRLGDPTWVPKVVQERLSLGLVFDIFTYKKMGKEKACT